MQASGCPFGPRVHGQVGTVPCEATRLKAGCQIPDKSCKRHLDRLRRATAGVEPGPSSNPSRRTSAMLTTVLLILLILLLFGVGQFYGNGAYRGPGFGIGGILLLVLIVLLVTRRL